MKYYGQIPTNIADLLILGPEMADGLTKDAAALDLKQITADQMTANTEALVAADKLFNISRSAQETAYGNFHSADDALSLWEGKVTGALSAFFGKRWNRQWIQVGFISPSIGIPDVFSDRLVLALRMIDFLNANPNYEAPNQGVTAANGKALRAAVVATQGLATDSDADVTNKGKARTAASDALTSMMRILIGLLAELLNADDTRWLDFGLALPAASTTPGQVQNVSAHLDGTGNLIVQCDATPLATRYRFRTMIVGAQQDYVLSASKSEPMASLGQFDPGQTVQITVEAVNGNLQGLSSDPIQFTMPVVVSAQPAPATSAVELVIEPAKAATNGNGNGHAHRTGNGDGRAPGAKPAR